MISSFEINNFKLFQSFKVDGLARMTILGGPNGVGKSSLLEAIFVHHDRFNPEMSLRHMGWRGLRQYASDPQSFFAPLFFRFDTSNVLSLESQDGMASNRLEIRVKMSSRLRRAHLQTVDRVPAHASETADQSSDVLELKYFKGDTQVNSGHVSLRASELSLNLEREPGELTPAVYLGTRMQSTPAEDVERLGALERKGETDLVVEKLKLVDPSIRSLTTIVAGKLPLVHADIGLNEKVPVYFLGDGVTRFLSILLGMAHARGGVLLLDDIDSGLHHSVLQKVWHALDEASHAFDCQLIATTHSYACLRAAREGLQGLLDPDFAFIRLEPTPSGIKAVNYSFDELGTAIDLDLEVR